MPRHYKKIITEKYVEKIIEDHLNQKVSEIKRFPMGLSHYVFDVITENGCACVIRTARPEREYLMQDGLYWHSRLQKIGIPLPKLYHTGKINQYIYAIYSRLPGRDLEEIYSELSGRVRKGIAETVSSIQQQIHTLKDLKLENALPWYDRVKKIVLSAENDMIRTKMYDKQHIDSLHQKLSDFKVYLKTVRPVSFLFDASVRNVMVHNKTVSGILDVDEVWYGDPLLTIGRGKSLLLI